MAKSAFVIKRSKDNQYYWVFIASNSESICTTETYTAKQSAKHSIKVIMDEAKDARVVDDSNYRFRTEN